MTLGPVRNGVTLKAISQGGCFHGFPINTIAGLNPPAGEVRHGISVRHCRARRGEAFLPLFSTQLFAG